ncbi:hypothetical protein DSO57_1032754 [Entomophthora muscae]|uniref:Uncharacterized protein n=1 Tax=Entomophthora muscae TaxID=34485 RepID=A0ACC2SP89_9FUNG|nr:hypothetical protein DSO57_1032754 [Entomophthora muscae]
MRLDCQILVALSAVGTLPLQRRTFHKQKLMQMLGLTTNNNNNNANNNNIILDARGGQGSSSSSAAAGGGSGANGGSAGNAGTQIINEYQSNPYQAGYSGAYNGAYGAAQQYQNQYQNQYQYGGYYGCYPGSPDPACSPYYQPYSQCYPGSPDPACAYQGYSSGVCYEGSPDPACAANPYAAPAVPEPAPAPEPAPVAAPAAEPAPAAAPAAEPVPAPAATPPAESARPADPAPAATPQTESAPPADPAPAATPPTEPAPPADPAPAATPPTESAPPADPSPAATPPTESAPPADPAPAATSPAESARPADPAPAATPQTESAPPADPAPAATPPTEPAPPADPAPAATPPTESAPPADPAPAATPPTESAPPADPAPAATSPAESTPPAAPAATEPAPGIAPGAKVPSFSSPTNPEPTPAIPATEPSSATSPVYDPSLSSAVVADSASATGAGAGSVVNDASTSNSSTETASSVVDPSNPATENSTPDTEVKDASASKAGAYSAPTTAESPSQFAASGELAANTSASPSEIPGMSNLSGQPQSHYRAPSGNNIPTVNNTLLSQELDNSDDSELEKITEKASIYRSLPEEFDESSVSSGPALMEPTPEKYNESSVTSGVAMKEPQAMLTGAKLRRSTNTNSGSHQSKPSGTMGHGHSATNDHGDYDASSDQRDESFSISMPHSSAGRTGRSATSSKNIPQELNSAQSTGSASQKGSAARAPGHQASFSREPQMVAGSRNHQGPEQKASTGSSNTSGKGFAMPATQSRGNKRAPRKAASAFQESDEEIQLSPKRQPYKPSLGSPEASEKGSSGSSTKSTSFGSRVTSNAPRKTSSTFQNHENEVLTRPRRPSNQASSMSNGFKAPTSSSQGFEEDYIPSTQKKSIQKQSSGSPTASRKPPSFQEFDAGKLARPRRPSNQGFSMKNDFKSKAPPHQDPEYDEVIMQPNKPQQKIFTASRKASPSFQEFDNEAVQTVPRRPSNKVPTGPSMTTGVHSKATSFQGFDEGPMRLKSSSQKLSPGASGKGSSSPHGFGQEVLMKPNKKIPSGTPAPAKKFGTTSNSFEEESDVDLLTRPSPKSPPRRGPSMAGTTNSRTPSAGVSSGSGATKKPYINTSGGSQQVSGSRPSRVVKSTVTTSSQSGSRNGRTNQSSRPSTNFKTSGHGSAMAGMDDDDDSFQESSARSSSMKKPSRSQTSGHGSSMAGMDHDDSFQESSTRDSSMNKPSGSHQSSQSSNSESQESYSASQDIGLASGLQTSFRGGLSVLGNVASFFGLQPGRKEVPSVSISSPHMGSHDE